MTKEQMIELIQSLNREDSITLRDLVIFGVGEWDKKTTINDKPFVCPECGGTGLLEIMDNVVDTWTAEDMTFGDNGYEMNKCRRWYYEDNGDLYFECVRCHRKFWQNDLMEMVGLKCDEEDKEEQDDEEEDDTDE
jgi:hypothetical protein